MIIRAGQPRVLPRRAVRIVPVRTAEDRDRFIRLPWQIYADDPSWVPPLLFERKEFINPRRHPFYQYGDAAHFIAYSDGAAVGRVLVADDPRFNECHGLNVGTFGMFESIDDEAVAHDLLDAAADWLRARGRTTIMGPIDYSTNYSCGLLVDGYQWPPRLMMNHNPPYYEPLLVSWGLEKTKDLYAWWFDTRNPDIQRWRHRVERLRQRSKITIRAMRRRDFTAELARCKLLYHECWKDNWGYAPMSAGESAEMGRQLRHFATPELMLMAEADGRPVGFSMTLPDLNEAIRPLNGRLTKFGLPIGFFKLRSNLKRIKTGRLIALGVLPHYRRRGIAEMLVLQSFTHATEELQYTGAELSWTLEDNALINRTIQAVGGQRYKTYRIYEKPLVYQSR